MLTSPVRKIEAKVEFFINSTLVETCQCNDRLASFTVERIGDESKFFGFGICQKLNVHLIDKDRELFFSTGNSIKLSYGINGEYVYPYPTFYISEIHRDENTNELSITAYDLMYPDTAHVVSDIELPESYTPLYFASAASVPLKANGISFKNITDLGGFQVEYEQGGNFEGHETIREALNDVAEITQTIYYIDNEDRLTFKRLNKDAAADLTITKEDYITLQSRTNRRLGTIYHTTELGDNLSVSTSTSGSTQYIRDNGFWTTLLSTEIADLLNDAIELVGGLTINQFDCSWRGNFLLEIGDKIALTAKDDSIITAYVLDDVITYNGSFNENTQWSYISNDNETPANTVTLGDALNQTFAKVDKINRKIDLVASNTEGLPEEIASLKLTTQEIEAKVEKLDVDDLGNIQNELASLKVQSDNVTTRVQDVETVNNEQDEEIQTLVKEVEQKVSADEVKILIKEEVIENEITSVTTQTGFTFNAEGLTVSKSGSEMSTQITEDGMTIDRGSTTVLTVNNTGVKAANLHATTYLIIGDTSRFEDYEENGQLRTGCFWQGLR